LYVADPGEDYDGFKIVKDLAAKNITDLESIRAVLDENHYAGVDEKVI
jgi:hypothetical protein